MTREAFYVSEGGRVRLYVGSCFDVVGDLDQPDHFIADPPYSKRTQAGARTLARGKHGANTGIAKRSRDDHSAGELGVSLVPFAMEAQQIRDVLILARARRWSLVFCDNVHAACLEVNPPSGHAHLGTHAWTKPDGTPQLTGDRPARAWEAIAALHRESERARWNAGGMRGVWHVPNHLAYEHGVERSVDHPTAKPLALMRKIIRDFTDPGDLILDPFAGSGTTLLAAALEGRRAVGVELSERWARGAADRIEKALRQVDLFTPAQRPKRMRQARLDQVEPGSVEQASTEAAS